MSSLRRVERDVEEPLLGESGDVNNWARDSKVPLRRSRLRRIAFVVSGVVALLVVALLIVKSQMHRIATNAIASTAMTIQRMELTRPQSDALTLSVRLDVDSSSPFPARIEATNFTIVYQEAAVGLFAAPAMAVVHGHNAQNFQNTTLRISNHTAWDAFARDLMLSQKLDYGIRGEISLSVSLLAGLIHLSASNVKLQKTMTSIGMDGLKRMEIADIVMDKSTQTQVLATIKTCLYNPSAVSIRPVGRICMDAHYPTPSATSHVAHLMTAGEASINITRDDPSHPYCAGIKTETKDMTHGYNLLELEGEMLGKNPVAISSLISKFLSNTAADMTVLACSPRATSVDIFNNAMMGLHIPASLPPRKEPLVGRMFFEGITLDAPTKGQENAFIGLHTNVTVEASSPLGPLSALQLQSINMSVDLYASVEDQNRELLLGTLNTRQVDIVDGRLVQVSNVSVRCDARTDFKDAGKAFGAFVRESVKQKKVQLRLKGHMNVVAQGALGMLDLKGLPMDITSELHGMDNFQAVTIDAFSLPGDAATPRGETLLTSISLLNPSLFAVSIGTVQLSMGLVESGDHLGELSGLMNLNLGDNKLSLKGRIDPNVDASGSVSAGVASFFSRYLRGEDSRVQVTIAAVQYPTCVWMNEALIGLKIETSFPGVQAGFELISGLEMRELDVAMEVATNSSASNTLMRVRTDLTATMKMPASILIPLDISNVSVALTLEDGKKSNMGTLTSDRELCEYKQHPSGYFRLNMSQFYPIEFPDASAAAAMALFVTDMLTKSGNVTMRITASKSPGSEQGAFPDVKTRMGMLPLAGVPIAGAPQIPGMDSFRNPPVKILSIDILEGTKESMTMDMSFEIVNPSIVKTALGKLVLDVLSSRARMGEATVDNFLLDCCGHKSILRGTFTFHPAAADLDIATRFLSNFVTGYFTGGKPQEIVIGGSRKSTPLDVLQPALVALRIPSLLPTLPDFFPDTPSLVTSSMLYLPSILHLNQMPTSLKLQNPFSENITVTGVDLLLYPCENQRSVSNGLVCDSYYTVPLARFAPDDFEPIFIPAKSKGCYSCCQGHQCETLPLCPHARTIGKCMAASVEGFISAEAIAAIFRTATTGLLMRVNGTIGAAIGAYETQLFYKQDALLVTLAARS